MSCLPNDIFNGLSGLKQLFLEENKLSSLPTSLNALNNLKRLKLDAQMCDKYKHINYSETDPNPSEGRWKTRSKEILERESENIKATPKPQEPHNV